MKIVESHLKGLFMISEELHQDMRGFLTEMYRKDLFVQSGVDVSFVQENRSRSKKNVIRGLHFQWQPKLGKLIRVSRGRAFLVAADIKKTSPTFGTWFGSEMGEDSFTQMYVSPGLATGFCALTEFVDIQYEYTAYYNPDGESNILWNDATFKIVWPISHPILSDRDKNAQTLEEWMKRPESDAW